MKKFNLTNLLYNLPVLLVIFAAIFTMSGPTAAIAITAAMLVLNEMAPRPKGVARNEVLKQLFSADLQETLFPDNTFYAGARSDAAGVDVDNIEIPQDENGETIVHENPTRLPLDQNTEEDTKKEYKAKLLVTAPTVITYNNQLLVSYDKRAAKLRKHQNSLLTKLANNIAYDWSPSVEASIGLTTGVNRPASAPGASGNRKKVTENNIIDAMLKFDGNDIPDGMGRKMLVPVALWPEIMAIRKAYASGTQQSNELLATGAVFELFGFQVYKRSRTQIFTEAALPVKKAPGAAAAATDNQAILFWHDDFVRYVKGSVKVALDPYDKPELAHGRSMNALIRGGGTIGRNDQKGVYALVEDNA